jgi:uncharacterized protein YoxC
MFPFLAVLLCTIGALVLILVISVVHSHASAKRDLDEEIQVRVEQAQEQSDYLHSITEELAARREKIKQEIDRRRKELANVEDHIARLKVQMDQLRSQMEGIESVDDQDEQGRKAKADKIAQLKKQIDARQRELAEEVQRLKNRKPAFSIIPYDGPNGTSRRPVYIECKSDGVVIQPEGIRLSMRDLRPPYGPGNPLDSALRVLRNAYQQRDATFGLNIPPYPLLIVRPDGIESYAMARAAMSGWDDQFGYELIDAEMELAFPPGIPSLANDLQVALDTARKRQDMLLAALPREYVRSKNLEEIDLDSITPDSYRDTSSPEGDGTSWGDDAGEWKMVQEVGGAPTPSNIASQGASRSPQGASSSTQGARSKAVGEFSPLSIPQGLPNTNAGSHPSSQTAQGRPGGSPGAAWAPGDALAYGDTSGSGSASSGGASETGNAASGSEGSSGTSSGNSGSSGGTANAQNSQSRSNAFSSGNAMGNASMSMGGSEAPSDPESEALGNAMRENQRNEESNPKKNSNPSASRQGKSNSETNDSPQRESSNNQDWAIPRHDRKATPVSRSIRIVALEDRWLIRKEDSETQFTTEIELALGPRQARETLEKAVRDRVDSWGLSLPGGYWVPAITIEAANDAQQSVDRLRKMLDGSGVEIRVVPLQAPAARQSPSKISPSRNVPSRR